MKNKQQNVSEFDLIKCKSIINNVCSTEKTRENVKKAIPVIVGWAQRGLTNKTYEDLAIEIGYRKAFSSIGSVLGSVADVLCRFRKITGVDLPHINALVKSKTTKLPSDGFEYVFPTYKKMTKEEKRTFVSGLNTKACEFNDWHWVLYTLGLAPVSVDITESEESIRSGNFGYGGEGIEHKRLKKYIYEHPESVNIKVPSLRKMEYVLDSGDKIDVYFEHDDGSRISVEVKPSTSPDSDILRGLFQCVKYKTVMDAENKVHYRRCRNKAILVIEGKLSSKNKMVQRILGITVYENFRLK